MSLDLQGDEGIWTSVSISMFTDARVEDESVLPPGEKNRGFFGDVVSDFPIGSKLWLLYRSKLTNETAAKAGDYTSECLQWMIDSGAADSIEVETERSGGVLYINVTIVREESDNESKKYSLNWDSMLKG